MPLQGGSSAPGAWGLPAGPPLGAGLWRQIQSEQLDFLCDWVEKSELSFVVLPEHPSEEWGGLCRGGQLGSACFHLIL